MKKPCPICGSFDIDVVQRIYKYTNKLCESWGIMTSMLHEIKCKYCGHKATAESIFDASRMFLTVYYVYDVTRIETIIDGEDASV